MHQIELAAEAALPQLALEALDVAVHQRLNECVGAGRGNALIFP
jgi:hypothetical protein